MPQSGKQNDRDASTKFVSLRAKMNALAPMHAGGMTLTRFKSWWWQNVHWCLYFLHLLSGRQKIECLL